MASLKDIYDLLSEAQDKMDLAQKHFKEAKDLLWTAKAHLLSMLPTASDAAPYEYTAAELEAKTTEDLYEIINSLNIPVPVAGMERESIINIILENT